MSGPLMQAVFGLDLPATEKHVATLLAWFGDDDGGNIRPSVARVAAMSGLSRRAVQLAIRRLERRGVLKRAIVGGGRYRTATYEMSTESCPKLQTANVVRPLRKETANPVRGIDGKTANVVHERANVVRETANVVRPISTYQKKTIRENHGTANAVPASPPCRERGSRIPEDFKVTPEHVAFAVKHGLPHPDGEIERFMDYWRGQPSNKATKADWDAVFRNWLRRSAEYAQSKAPPKPAPVAYMSDKTSAHLLTPAQREAAGIKP